MTIAHKRRLDALESAIATPEGSLTVEWARARVAVIRAEGRAQDQGLTECGGLFSPAQLCRMVDMQSTNP